MSIVCTMYSSYTVSISVCYHVWALVVQWIEVGIPVCGEISTLMTVKINGASTVTIIRNVIFHALPGTQQQAIVMHAVANVYTVFEIPQLPLKLCSSNGMHVKYNIAQRFIAMA